MILFISNACGENFKSFVTCKNTWLTFTPYSFSRSNISKINDIKMEIWSIQMESYK